MAESGSPQSFAAAVERELADLQGRRPAWSSEGTLAGRLRSLEREERAARRDRRSAQERLDRRRERADTLERGSGETWLRERLSATPWGVPKEVWRARRDREREVLDAEEELLAERLAARERYLADLSALEPGGPWAGAQPADDVAAEELDRLWRERRRALDSAAERLIARPEVRAALCGALSDGGADAHAVARAATPHLLGLHDLPRIPALFAALALLALREGSAQLGC